MGVIPFYGAEQPEMFAIERRAMDRDGLVLKTLDRLLPAGRILDVGAGDGFTAARLRGRRSIVALEPSAGMIANVGFLSWVRGDAEQLPFADGMFDAAYATWAYFFSRDWDPTPGITELDRVVRPGGVLAIADNLGDDEFCSLADQDISADPAFWAAQGFHCEVIETCFRFEDRAEAERLLSFFFGERGMRTGSTEVAFRVGLFSRASRGPAASRRGKVEWPSTATR